MCSIAALTRLWSSSMEPVLPRRLQVNVSLLHVLRLVLLHQLVPLTFGGHDLVAMVTNKFLWSLYTYKKQAKQSCDDQGFENKDLTKTKTYIFWSDGAMCLVVFLIVHEHVPF